MATLSTKLLNIRKKHRLSQTEIANILNVSQNAYHRWESDKCKPSIDNLVKISQYFNIDVAKLLDDNEKIVLPNNELNSSNNILSNTLEIHPTSIDIMERVLQTQEQIAKLLVSQFRLIEEIAKRKQV